MSIKKELQLIDQLENLIAAAEEELERWQKRKDFNTHGEFHDYKNTLFEKIAPYFWERVRKLNLWVEGYIEVLEKITT